tara:strand:- start:411 stop:713 length:303 start_codon:yes stop_codon:yes gene_type:complete
MALLALSTVYETRGAFEVRERGNIAAQLGTLQVKSISGTPVVSVYESNEVDKPANVAAMTKSGELDVGVHVFKKPTRWVAFTVAGGVAELYEFLLTEDYV